MRSFLFVPGDSERKQTKALASYADALILDLEDSVDLTRLPAARAQVHKLLQSRPEHRRQQLWVRVNALSSGLLLDDLAVVMEGTDEHGPDGIVLPKVSHPAEIDEVAHYLAALEHRGARPIGATRIMVIAAETPRSLLSLQTYFDRVPASATITQRLAALTWGSEDLRAALGATDSADHTGALTPAFQLARTSCLLTATALGVQPIDGVHADFRNKEGLARDLQNARRDGFTGKLAIHPDQVEAINAAFIPTEAEIAWARRIVATFAASPGTGVVSLDGHMVDRPHLMQAQRVMEAAENEGASG